MVIASTNPLPAKSEGKLFSLSLTAMLWIAVFLLVAGIIVPLYPKFPAAGLDPSWAFAMQEAVAQGLRIGKNVIFTLGPYASLFRSVYQPQTDLLGLLGGLLLSIIFSTLLLINYRHLRRWGTLAITIAFCWLIAISSDSRLFAYPLLLALTLYSLINRGQESTVLRVLFILCTAGLGLLPLIKGSLLPLCLCIGLLCAALAWLCKERAIAVFTLLLPPVAAIGLWLGAGQPISTLLPFFQNILPLISGYSNAMATYGETPAIITYIVVCGLLLVSLLPVTRPRAHTLYLLLALALYLFLSFKAAFVRVDHISIALGSLLLAALLVAQHSKLSLRASSAIGCFIFAMQVTSYDLLDIQKNFINRYVEFSQAVIERSKSPKTFKDSYSLQLALIRKSDPLPVLKGTSDIYPWDISSLIASGNKWSPRPVFQSYASYTSGLALANEAHLRSANAPDNIFIRVASIDGRLPSMEDGASWPTILREYTPASISGRYLVFHREPSGAGKLNEKQLFSQKVTLGQLIEVPQHSGALFARIIMSSTLRGEINNTLLKRDSLSLNLELNNGSVRKYHFVPSMAKSGFIISPLVEDIYDLALLADGAANQAGDKAVIRFSITADAVTADWQDSFKLQLTQMDIPTRKQETQNLFDTQINPSMDVQNALERADCEGFIDNVNGTPAGTSEVMGRNLHITGWTALSTKENKLPNQVYITLTDENGLRKLYATKVQVRPDLATHFNFPSLAQAGFISIIDARQLIGNYKIGVLRGTGGRYEHCQLSQAIVPINTISQTIEPSQQMLKPQTRTYCDGQIDHINGVSAKGISAISGASIEIDGWSALSTTEGTIPEDIFIKLTDENGVSRLYPTGHHLRPDVEKHFGKPHLVNAGYRTRIHTRNLSGRYQLSLLRSNGSNIEQCPGLPQTVLINTGRPSSLAARATLHAQQRNECEGSLDSINGKPFDAPLNASTITSIEGWTVLPSIEGRLPETVFVTLKDQAGMIRAFPSEPEERDDINKLFHNKNFDNSGFLAHLDEKVSEGMYRVGIIRTNGGKFEACQSLERTLTVN